MKQIEMVLVNTNDAVKALEGRRVGNSTRQLNFAIEAIFSDYMVEIRDHFDDGKCRSANTMLFERLRKRIKSEHPFMLDKIIFDEENLIAYIGIQNVTLIIKNHANKKDNI